MMNTFADEKLPYLGFGLGLRTVHYDAILADKPPVDFFEILVENYLIPGGKPLAYLDKIRADYPMVMHGVSLSIGSVDPLDRAYLRDLKALAKRVDPAFLSDHLCWTGIFGFNTHDLLPLPYTEETITHVVSRISQVQEVLGYPFLLENVSSYLSYLDSEMTEWAFLTEIAERSGCYILLDVNNVYVSAYNHGFNPQDYLNALPRHKVAQIHLAGHSNFGKYLLDTHDAPILPEVWALYRDALARFGAVSTMIEYDDNIPPLSVLLTDLDYARGMATELADTQGLWIPALGSRASHRAV